MRCVSVWYHSLYSNLGFKYTSSSVQVGWGLIGYDSKHFAKREGQVLIRGSLWKAKSLEQQKSKMSLSKWSRLNSPEIFLNDKLQHRIQKIY